jgi:hypothetical protein
VPQAQKQAVLPTWRQMATCLDVFASERCLSVPTRPAGLASSLFEYNVQDSYILRVCRYRDMVYPTGRRFA